MKKKVLINLRLLQQPYTGVQSYVYNLVRSLIEQTQDFEFHIAVINYQKGNSYLDDILQHKNVKLINTKGLNNAVFGVFFDIFLINKHVKNVDLYFSPVNILPLFKSKKVPHVVGVLDLCTFIVPKTTTLTLKTYYNLYLKTSLQRADAIVTISQNTKDDLLRLFKLKEAIIKVVHLGVDKDFDSSPMSIDEELEVLNGFGLGQESRYFLAMGTSKRKNVEKVIEAFSELSKSDKNLRLVIVVNDSGMKDLITNTVAENSLDKEQVIMTGRYVSPKELKTLYKKAVGFVYCPFYEGFGLPILEAMKNNCPVITSNNSSLSEIAGDVALFAEVNKVGQITQHMNLLLSDASLRDSLISKGKINAQKYSWEVSAQEYNRIFRGLL